MLNPYDFALLKQKLNSKDPVDVPRALYSMVRHIENLERKMEEMNQTIEQLRGRNPQSASS